MVSFLAHLPLLRCLYLFSESLVAVGLWGEGSLKGGCKALPSCMHALSTLPLLASL